MSNFIGKLVFYIVVFMVPLHSIAADYYVDGSVEFSGDGTLGSPYKTISECSSAMGAGGDTCYIMAGTYNENISAVSGVDGNKNIYVAYQWEEVIITGTFSLSNKQDIKIVGIGFTGGTSYTMTTYNALRCEVIHCEFYYTSNIPIRDNNDAYNTSGTRYMILRGNTIHDPGCLVSDVETCSGSSAVWFKGNNILIEYNMISRLGGDFINARFYNGIIRNNVFRDFDFAYFPGNPGTAHPDIIQAYASSAWPSYNVFYESNYASEVADNDAHFIQIRYLSNDSDFYDWTIRGNMAHSIGSYFHQLEGVDSTRIYNNSFTDAVNGSTYGLATWASVGNYNFNNLYYENDGTPLNPYSINAGNGTSVTSSNNGCVVGSTHASCEENTDPLFVSYETDDFHIQADSPVVGSGKEITTVNNNSGSGTSFVVTDAKYFTDGMGMADGDRITVGSNLQTMITEINYATNTITVEDSQTWVNGDGIYWRNQDATPDIGAFEYDSNGYEYTISISNATCLSGDSVDINVSLTGSNKVRMVIWYIDGVPKENDINDSSPSYTFDISGYSVGDTPHVRVVAYALYADIEPYKIADKQFSINASCGLLSGKSLTGISTQ